MIDRLIGHLPDIEQEIYEDQLRHIISGVLVKKHLIQDHKSKMPSIALAPSMILSHRIRDNILFNPNKCFFPLDKISITNNCEEFCLIKLKEKGSDRETVESKDGIFDSSRVIAGFKKEFSSYMKNLTIESFIQMNGLRLFKLIGIDDPFFEKISKENYESLEKDFTLKMKNLCLKDSFNFSLDDAYLYRRGLVVYQEGIDFDFSYLEKIGNQKNPWDQAEIIKIT